MSSIEKILSNILHNMNNDDAELLSNIKSVHDKHINPAQNKIIEEKKTPGEATYKTTNTPGLDVLIKEAILQWVESPSGKKFLKDSVLQVIEEKINIPTDYIKTAMSQKLSEAAIFRMFKDVLKERLLPV